VSEHRVTKPKRGKFFLPQSGGRGGGGSGGGAGGGGGGGVSGRCGCCEIESNVGGWGAAGEASAGEDNRAAPAMVGTRQAGAVKTGGTAVKTGGTAVKTGGTAV